jgi:hypothetical protein
VVVGLAEKKLLSGEESKYSFLAWKSAKLTMASSATLFAEAQGQLKAMSRAEWMVHRLSEAKGNSVTMIQVGDKGFDLEGWLHPPSPLVPLALFTDCKSLYDNLASKSSSAAGISDPKCALTVTALKEALARTHGVLRWIPSGLQIADALTKVGDCDFLRALMQSGRCQVVSEEEALQTKARAKEERLARGVARATAAAKKNGSSLSPIPEGTGDATGAGEFSGVQPDDEEECDQ